MTTPDVPHTAKHTPGPWKVDGFAVTGPGMVQTWQDGKMSLKNETVCRITAKDDPDIECANAQLIAAAPLLPLLLEALEAWEVFEENDSHGVRQLYDKAMQLTHAALAATRQYLQFHLHTARPAAEEAPR
jgi:hypothetical protein